MRILISIVACVAASSLAVPASFAQQLKSKERIYNPFLLDNESIDAALSGIIVKGHDYNRIYAEWSDGNLDRKSEFESTQDYQDRLAKGHPKGGIPATQTLIYAEKAGPFGKICENVARYDADRELFKVDCAFRYIHHDTIEFGGNSVDLDISCISSGEWKPYPQYPTHNKNLFEDVKRELNEERQQSASARNKYSTKKEASSKASTYVQLCLSAPPAQKADRWAFELEVPFPKKYAKEYKITGIDVIFAFKPIPPLSFVEKSLINSNTHLKLLGALTTIVITGSYSDNERYMRQAQTYTFRGASLVKTEHKEIVVK